MNETSEKHEFFSKNSDDEIEIDLKELFYFLLSRWVLILLFVLLGAGIAGAYHTFLLKPTYKADASIYITNTNSVLTISDLQLSSALTDDYTQIITSRTILKKVISELNLDLNYKQLNSLITVTNPNSSHIVCISVTCDDKELCRDITNSLMNNSIEQIYRIIGSNEPTIIDRSEIDSVQDITPSKIKFIVIGAGIGGILIVVTLIVKMIMDTTLKQEDAIEQLLNLPVLTAVPYYKKNYK